MCSKIYCNLQHRQDWKESFLAPEKKALTTTSHALLGLLSIKPWSGYELAEQMKRGFGTLWPRAERAIYYEPKNLVAHGLAEAKVEKDGGRRRTIYAITDKGRDALTEWLASGPPAPPRLETEALLRMGFAGAGTKEDLLGSIKTLNDHAGRGPGVHIEPVT